MLEDVTSALPLLLSELNRRSERIISAEEELHHHSQEIQSVRDAAVQRESRIMRLEQEVVQGRQLSEADNNSLRQCLAQVEESLGDTQKEKQRIYEASRKHAAEAGATIASLQKKLTDVQNMGESRKMQLDHSLVKAVKEKEHMEASVLELRDQLNLRITQLHQVQEENSLLVEGLRTTLKQQQTQIEQLQQQLSTITTEKNSLTSKTQLLENELSDKQDQHQELLQECLDLKTRIRNLQEDHSDTEKTLHDKIDNLTAVKCELEGRIRSQDLAMLQVKDLQERIWRQSHRRRDSSSDSVRSSEASPSVSGLPPGRSVTPQYGSSSSLHSQLENAREPRLSKHEEDSFGREEKLHVLLREKDDTLHSLHNSFSAQLTAKNQDLETLTNKLGGLEEQLSTLLSGLEVSAAIGSITTEVGRELESRTHHLDSLDQNSHLMQEELSSLALENHSLKSKLMSTVRSERESSVEAQELARQARQESREERLASVRIKEKCCQLQARLDAALLTLQQERQDRRLTEVVHKVKHREFGSVLESSSLVLQSSHKTQELSDTTPPDSLYKMNSNY